MSLSFTGLERLEGGQQGIEGFFAGGQVSTPVTKPSSDTTHPSKATGPTSSEVKSPKRYRSPSPMIKPKIETGKKPRLGTLHTGPARKTGLESFLSGKHKRGESSTSAQAQISARTSVPKIGVNSDIPPRRKSQEVEVVDLIDNDEGDITETEEKVDGNNKKWTCPRCGFTPVIEALSGYENEKEENEESSVQIPSGTRTREIRQEHEDFHFAQDLQLGVSPVRSRQLTESSKARTGDEHLKKKKKKPVGIKAFFAPKSSK